MTTVVIQAAVPQARPDCLQAVQQEQLLLVYTKNPDQYYFSPSESREVVSKRHKQEQWLSCNQGVSGPLHQPVDASFLKKSRSQISGLKEKSKAHPFIFNMIEDAYSDCELAMPSKTSLMLVERKSSQKSNGNPGITIIDLKTGLRLGFIQLVCDHEIHALVFDSMRREILAGKKRTFSETS